MAVGDVLQIVEGAQPGSLVRVWGPQSGGGGSGTPFTDTFTGDGVEDTFTLSVEPDFAVVIVSGVVFGPADYVITGDQLVFTNPPTTATDEIVVQGWVGAGPGGGTPGEELDYVEITSPVSITATSEATANTAITGSAIAYDGSTTVMIECFTPALVPDTTAPRDITIWLYDGSSSIGALAQVKMVSTSSLPYVITASRRLTPSAGTHTYSLRCSVSAGTGSFSAGAGGTGAYSPAYIRITRV